MSLRIPTLLTAGLFGALLAAGSCAPELPAAASPSCSLSLLASSAPPHPLSRQAHTRLAHPNPTLLFMGHSAAMPAKHSLLISLAPRFLGNARWVTLSTMSSIRVRSRSALAGAFAGPGMMTSQVA